MMAAGEVRVQATAVGTREELREVLALAGQGQIRCHVQARPLANANEVLDQLRRGQVPGRVVLTFS